MWARLILLEKKGKEKDSMSLILKKVGLGTWLERLECQLIDEIIIVVISPLDMRNV